MDLIEIVQKSLTYFGILAIIVIVGSYVSYKVRKKLTGEKLPYEDDLEKAKAELKERKKKGKEKKTEDEGEEKERDLKKPIIIHSDSKKHIHVKKKIKDKTRSDKELEEEYKRKKENYQRKKAEYDRRKKRKVTQIFSRRHRIEIINKTYSSGGIDDTEAKTPSPESIRARKTDDKLNPKKKKKLQSLDENVLDKYAGEDDDQFFTIKPGSKDK